MTALYWVSEIITDITTPEIFHPIYSVIYLLTPLQGLEGGALFQQSTLSTTLRLMNQRFAPADKVVRGVCHLIP